MKTFAGLLLLLIFVSCSTMHQTNKFPTFDTEAHRGGRGIMPENTIPAMLNALDIGVSTLEMDAVITGDQQVILSHEPFFNSDITSRKDGTLLDPKDSKSLNIFRMSYAETQQYDVGLKAHPRFPKQKKLATTKPLLSDVIDSVEAHTKLTKRPLPYYNIETKTQPSTDGIFHPAPAEFVDLLMSVINRKEISDRVIIQSFDFRTLILLHKKFPSIKTAALVEDRNLQPDSVIKLLGFTPTIYSPEFSMVDEQMVRLCHSLGMKILPWTVNTAAEINRLKQLGVDGIISDYPNLFSE
jgi:glycerophosphoryl diester phosphodiesterase